MKIEWALCPFCKNKTRLKIREDTILENFPLFCPKCKQETLINVKQMNITVIREPAAQTQSLNWLCGELGIVKIHLRPYHPRGKAKIERSHRTEKDR